jgi:hypothetical protein
MALTKEQREKKNARSRERYLENIEYEKSRKVEDRKNNPEKYKERAAKYYVDNKEQVLEYREDNKERTKIQRAEYRLENIEEIKEKDAKRYEANKEVKCEKQKEYRIKNNDIIRAKATSTKCRARSTANSVKRQVSKIQATPKTLSVEQIKEIQHFYVLAQELEQLNGIKYHVDHIVPLRGKTVCGLHVPWNLQVLTAEENMKKHNKLVI